MKYALIKGDSAEEVDRWVNSYLNDGYRPHGSPQVAMTIAQNGMIIRSYIQALVKD